MLYSLEVAISSWFVTFLFWPVPSVETVCWRHQVVMHQFSSQNCALFLAWPSLALLITNHPVVGQKSTHDIPWHFHNKIPTQKSYLQYLQSPPIWFMEVPKKLSLPKTSRGFVDVLPTRPNGTCRWRNSSAGSSQRILPPWEVLWTPWKALWRTWSCWLQVDRWTKQINAT